MSDSKPSPTLEGGKVKNVKDAAEESQIEKNENAIKSLAQLRREILSGGINMDNFFTKESSSLIRPAPFLI